jgi:hypothetical protein
MNLKRDAGGMQALAIGDMVPITLSREMQARSCGA